MSDFPPVCVFLDRAPWLDGKSANVNSQFGEDGLIAAALDHFGTVNKWCFEVGAADGEWISNTKCLREAGWHCVLIEASDAYFEKLVKLQSASVHVVHRFIGADDLDVILAEHGAPPDLDFGSIDIDGQDYWVWDGLKTYRPRIICIEHCTAEGHSIPPKGAQGIMQASRSDMIELAEKKGYTPLAATHCNLICCRSELLS